VPTVADEIQSCVWSPELFLFREYGLEPDIVPVGKGFPGGEYPAARVLFSPGMDTLQQFGALVTNGQEEIASLAFLVTIAFARANSEFIRDVGEYYEAGLKDLAARYPAVIERMEGRRHLASLFFHKAETVTRFVSTLVQGGIGHQHAELQGQLPALLHDKAPADLHAEGGGIPPRQDGRGAERTVMAARRRVRFGIIGLGLMGREFGSAIGRWCHLLTEARSPSWRDLRRE